MLRNPPDNEYWTRFITKRSQPTKRNNPVGLNSFHYLTLDMLGTNPEPSTENEYWTRFAKRKRTDHDYWTRLRKKDHDYLTRLRKKDDCWTRLRKRADHDYWTRLKKRAGHDYWTRFVKKHVSSHYMVLYI